MVELKRDIIIANPMYDVVFKNLMMEDRDIAGYFVGTILGVEIVDIDFHSQEYTYDRSKDQGDKLPKLRIVRMDFVAVIRTKDGVEKKVLIEVQQSHKPLDMVRFSKYIGAHYMERESETKTELEMDPDRKEIRALPIIAIYLLGYEMPANPHVAVRIDRTGMDIIGGEKVSISDPLIETLTHEAYFIQVSRIGKEMYEDMDKCSELLKLLSLFQQDYFTERNYYKRYPYSITHKTIEKMITTLTRLASDPYVKRVMEEQELDAREVSILKNTIAQRDNIISQSRKALAQKDKLLEEYQRRYGNLNVNPN